MSKPETVRVDLGDRSYDILVGEGLLARAGELIKAVLPGNRVIIVSDERVAKDYAPILVESLNKAGITNDVIPVPMGEGGKTFSSLEIVCEKILAFKPDRKTTLIALGGGAVGDLTGFAASIILRGIPFIQIPTTLLAQVDSSVGGKTAINAAAGKNLIGSFYQPLLVIADLNTTKTLERRERLAGYAEVIKYGLIMDEKFYRWCLANAEKLLDGDVDALRHAVTESCKKKAEIVGADERESAARALLNFGHTFGHALEAETGMDWKKLMHGEAVAIGMVMACRLSEKMKLISADAEKELTAHFKQIGMPAVPGDIKHAWNADGIASHFVADKKAEAGTLTFIVLDKIGKARVAKNVDAALASSVVASYLN